MLVLFLLRVCLFVSLIKRRYTAFERAVAIYMCCGEDR